MIDKLITRLSEGTCNFTAVKVMIRELEEAGFIRLEQSQPWDLKPRGRYYVVKNDSAIFAFVIGKGKPSEEGFHIIASHSDSPGFKIKPNAEIYGDGGVVSLNVEKYGGGILYTWFDRPLSIAGRVMLRTDDPLNPQSRIVDLRKPVATIPHLSIHLNRSVNEGNPLSVQKDMKPVLGYWTREEFDRLAAKGGIVKNMLAEEICVEPEDILDYELNLYPIETPMLTGLKKQYLQSGRIDDLEMAFGSLQALLDSLQHGNNMKSDLFDDEPFSPAATRVMAVFDNEETGSGTKQGAHSPVLSNILNRICQNIEGDNEEAYYMALAQSFMISADDAHAWHPNYNEKYDPTNHPVIGGGPAIKINANCKYMTDGDAAAVFAQICKMAGVKFQYFVNHSDVAGGSTLGNILTGQMDIRGVDMGNPVWAMHSAVETCGVDDHEAAVKAFTTFYLL
ncbi:MAG: M18 family aminopeptidase [Prevotella sp.]|nr:M18 family aminopeptidase [Bacteroides sp.]MCM1366172.1 M18 family aminopeptidase [Prevotella sp.]MCM1436763.1 M18 family aminopeptidase [Prevotella sp.]